MCCDNCTLDEICMYKHDVWNKDSKCSSCEDTDKNICSDEGLEDD